MEIHDEISVGQVYRDCDPRTPRLLRVVTLEALNGVWVWVVENMATGRRTRIDERRLVKGGSRGYELVTPQVESK